jgi:hypothetical protein
MTSKSRHKRGKQALPSKKKRRKQTSVLTTTVADEPATPAITPATPLPPTAPPVAVPKSRPAAVAASYPYVPGELKRIGIMAVIMLAVLIVLSRVIV